MMPPNALLNPMHVPIARGVTPAIVVANNNILSDIAVVNPIASRPLNLLWLRGYTHRHMILRCQAPP